MAEKLNADLNIIQRSGIEITVDPITADLNIIQKLDDEPNDVGGLSAAELKAKFDEAGNTIKEFINGSLIPQVVGADAVEQVREENEAARVAAETAREQAEAARAAAETEREENETARVAAETARETAFAAAQEERAAEFDEAQASRAAVFSAGEEARNFWDDYDPTKDYVPGNKVYYLGSSYVNKVACRGVLPTVEDNWQMIAKKGQDGEGGMGQDEADLRYLQLAGGTMTGPLRPIAPEADEDAANKGYADARETAANQYTDSVRMGILTNDVFPRPQTLTAATAALYGLPETAVPDDVLAKIAPDLLDLQSRAKIEYGTYTGTGDDAGARIVFPFQPKIFFAISHMTTSDYVGFAIKNNATSGTSGIAFHYDLETTSGKVNTTLYDVAIDSGGIRVVAKGGFNVRNRTYSYLGIGLGEEAVQ